MTCPSDRQIYYLVVKLWYWRNQRKVFAKTWIVSRYNDAMDIMMYDDRTMRRLRKKYYGKRRVKDPRVTINEIVSCKAVGTYQVYE